MMRPLSLIQTLSCSGYKLQNASSADSAARLMRASRSRSISCCRWRSIAIPAMCVDGREPLFFPMWSAFFFTIHREGTKNVALGRNDWRGPAGAESADFCKPAIIGPKRISHYISDDDSLAPVHCCAARTITWTDRGAIDRFYISFWKIRCGAVTDMFPVPIQKQNRAAQTFRLSFHEKNKTLEHFV